MRRFARALVAIFGMVLLGSFLLLVPQKNAAAQDSGPTVTIASPLPLPVKGNVNAAVTGSVNVANTAANPVPVSGLVAVGNEKTLVGGGFVPVPLAVNVTNGTLPVTGSVSISGTPTVQLAAPNLSLNGPVQVTNPTQTVSNPFGTVTQAVPLFVRDGSALTPYRRNCSGTFVGSTSNVGSCDLGVVPNNVQLVIEQVSGHLTSGSVGGLPLTVFQVALSDGAQSYDFNVFQIGADLGVSQQVRIYVDGGSDVSVSVKEPPASTFGLVGLIQQFRFDICGYTVNLQ